MRTQREGSDRGDATGPGKSIRTLVLPVERTQPAAAAERVRLRVPLTEGRGTCAQSSAESPQEKEHTTHLSSKHKNARSSASCLVARIPVHCDLRGRIPSSSIPSPSRSGSIAELADAIHPNPPTRHPVPLPPIHPPSPPQPLQIAPFDHQYAPQHTPDASQQHGRAWTHHLLSWTPILRVVRCVSVRGGEVSHVRAVPNRCQ